MSGSLFQAPLLPPRDNDEPLDLRELDLDLMGSPGARDSPGATKLAAILKETKKDHRPKVRSILELD